MNKENEEISPGWSNTTKFIVGISAVALVALMLIQFRNLVGPLILAIVLAYLLYPLANSIRNKLKISWAFSVNLIYILVILVLAGLLTWGGIMIVDPIQSLIDFIDRNLADIPGLLNRISQFGFQIGNYEFSLKYFDISQLADRVLAWVQPIFSSAGSLVGTFASGAASTIGLFLFILVISYFVLSETKGARDKVIDLKIPGYQRDLERLGGELDRIWNAFLRGQVILMFMTIMIYAIFLSIFGVKFSIGLAIMAGLARFLPYIGPWITWVTYFLVCLLQGSTIFGLTPFFYSILIVGVAVLVDTIIDNVVVPRVYSNTLKVHPAGVLVALLISASWLGLIGVVLAAPVLASLKLFSNYAFRKMLDQDPWEAIISEQAPPAPDLPRVDELPQYYDTIKTKVKNKFRKKNKVDQTDKN